MDKTLQIVELMLTEMEKEPNRYRLEITTKGLLISDCKEMNKGFAEMPTYYTFFYEPSQDWHHDCNKQFEEFIGGLKA